MKCPECQKEGLRSTVTHWGGVTTAMYCPPFSDEDGRRHNHDVNQVSGSHSCSNGHRWWAPVSHTCWCGWTNAPKEEE